MGSLRKIDSALHQIALATRVPFSPEALSGILSRSGWVASATTLKVAYSGGLDSTVLLHALAGLRPAHGWRLEAVHVQHGLHPQAEAWLDQCRRFCQVLSVPLRVERARIVSTADTGLEAAARHARYACLVAQIGPTDVLLTAHHLDDQAETLLLQLLRGAGVEGLAAMSADAPLGEGRHARPLLGFRRAALLAYARTEGLAWVEDSSNLDTRLGRNFLRYRALPLLESRWPSVATRLARAADHAAEASFLLACSAAEDLRRCRRIGDTIDLTTLGCLTTPQQRNVLRQWIRQRGLPAPPARAIDGLLAYLRCRPRTGYSRLSIGHYRIYLYQHHFHLVTDRPEPPTSLLDWDPARPLLLPHDRRLLAVDTIGAGIARAKIDGRQLTVDWRQGGECCRLAGQSHRQTLKKLLQSSAIPPWERHLVPLVRVDGQLAAIGDRWICEPFAARAHEPGYLLRIADVSIDVRENFSVEPDALIW